MPSMKGLFLLDVEEEFQSGFSFGARRNEERGTGREEPARHNLDAIFEMASAPDFNEVEVVPEESEGIVIGMRVRHGKFGVGTVRKIEGLGDEQKVIVWFNSVGPKKLLVRFAGLARA